MVRPIKGYEGLYEVSDSGEIYSLRFKNVMRILKRTPNKTNNGYYRVGLTKNRTYKSFPIHRLVAQAFLPNPQNRIEINHKNGIKTDNRVENLEWSTRSENVKHAFDMLGRKNPSGKDNVNSKPVLCISPDGKNAVYNSIGEAERVLGVNKSAIWQALKNKYAMKNGMRWEYAKQNG